MKVLFLNPPWGIEEESYGRRAGSRWAHRLLGPTEFLPPPFFMLFSASWVEKIFSFPVKIIDALAENKNKQRVLYEISLFSPKIVFIETSTPLLQVT